MDLTFDVLTIGAGHAGVESALAAARMGLTSCLVTLNLDSMALMPCNPAIGGTSKGHLVREVDALGGEMGRAADDTALQIRLLNTSKGPAVRSLRAQADKKAYTARMRRALEDQEGLSLLQGEAVKILTENGVCVGAELADGTRIGAGATVIATGVYLRARVFVGDNFRNQGPSGLAAANELTQSLMDLGIEMRRFKTGTPPRIDAETVDFSRMTIQPGDPTSPWFSFMTDAEPEACPQIPCYLTYTNEETHRIIRENLHRSPMYSGKLHATGVRYCPSIEDKVVRFSEKPSHQLFLEPEGANTHEMYLQGLSTSLPADVQRAMVATIPGLEHAKILRMGYGIEYDCLDSLQLDASLAVRSVPGLYTAGQINGTSGYEEAAGQGILAGINAALHVKGLPPFTLSRSDAYIGVLVDDLITRGATEPYRMMTSRAEYRLLLRQDNADLRLTEKGHALGLATEERYQRMLRKRTATEELIRSLRETVLPPSEELRAVLEEAEEPMPASGAPMAQLLKRPRVTLAKLMPLWKNAPENIPADAAEQAEIALKYEGYLAREEAEVRRTRDLESKALPSDWDYSDMPSLRLEAREKLSRLRPANIGQASRILGVSPADVAVLLVALKRRGKD